jgi:hypothetical protein
MSSSARHHLENYNLAAQLAACDAVTDGTTVKQDHYWRYWETYLKAIKLDDDPFTQNEQHQIVAGFGTNLQANDVQDYKGPSDAPTPVSGTIHTTFNAVAQTFRENDLLSPCHDNNGCLPFILQ